MPRYLIIILTVSLTIAVIGFTLMFLVLCMAERQADAGQMQATYYSEELRGSPTASGEAFNPDGYTAAHKTLPLGTQLRVCYDDCTNVRINDRGPVGADIDLSRAAAESIGIDDEGVAPVEAEQISREPLTELPKTGALK